MPLLLKTNKWNKCNHWVKTAANTWSSIPQIYVKTSDTTNKWKPLYRYSWEVGAWVECSKACNTGTQTRSVRCKREDGQYFPDSFCTKLAGAKPATSQTCNAHSCNYWYKGGYDDCAVMHTWNGSGWRQIWSNCGATRWIEFQISSPDFGDIMPTPIRWEMWDTNGTSYHGQVQLCTTYNTCSDNIVYFPKQGECGGGVFYYTWDARNNASVRVRCRKRDYGCDGCSACSDSGWGYLNCSSNYPSWANG